MRKKDLQKNLLYITKKRIETLESKKIVGATAAWKDNTAYISIFFDIDPSEEELEEASDICTEIIAEMPSESFLNEEFVMLKKTDKLPTEFLAFKRD